MDTIGALVDKLVTVKLKLHYASEPSDDSVIASLTTQRNQLVTEITDKFEAMALEGRKIADVSALQKKYKVY